MKMYKPWIGALTIGLFTLGSMALADDKEERVSLDKVPAAVKATIEKESQGAKLKEIHKETEGGKTIYEAEIVKDGNEFQIHVAGDGTVTKRETGESD